MVHRVSGMLSAFGSFLAAAIGWIALEFVARPFRKFFDLRGEIIQLSVQTANVRARVKESRSGFGEPEILDLSEDDIKRLDAAQNSYRELASRMSAFAENETLAFRAALILGYDPASASAALIGISNTRHLYGQAGIIM